MYVEDLHITETILYFKNIIKYVFFPLCCRVLDEDEIPLSCLSSKHKATTRTTSLALRQETVSLILNLFNADFKNQSIKSGDFCYELLINRTTIKCHFKHQSKKIYPHLVFAEVECC